jgi:hypothetical protein
MDHVWWETWIEGTDRWSSSFKGKKYVIKLINQVAINMLHSIEGKYLDDINPHQVQPASQLINGPYITYVCVLEMDKKKETKNWP